MTRDPNQLEIPFPDKKPEGVSPSETELKMPLATGLLLPDNRTAYWNLINNSK